MADLPALNVNDLGMLFYHDCGGPVNIADIRDNNRTFANTEYDNGIDGQIETHWFPNLPQFLSMYYRVRSDGIIMVYSRVSRDDTTIQLNYRYDNTIRNEFHVGMLPRPTQNWSSSSGTYYNNMTTGSTIMSETLRDIADILGATNPVSLLQQTYYYFPTPTATRLILAREGHGLIVSAPSKILRAWYNHVRGVGSNVTNTVRLTNYFPSELSNIAGQPTLHSCSGSSSSFDHVRVENFTSSLPAATSGSNVLTGTDFVNGQHRARNSFVAGGSIRAVWIVEE